MSVIYALISDAIELQAPVCARRHLFVRTDEHKYAAVFAGY